MGLGYLFLFIMIGGAAGIGVVSLIVTREIWRKPRVKLLAVLPLLLAGACFAVAFFLLYTVWREPPWEFRF